MAINRTPVLKRCRSLGLEPAYLGYDKKSNRTNARAGKKVSEYGLQLPRLVRQGVLHADGDLQVFRAYHQAVVLHLPERL